MQVNQVAALVNTITQEILGESGIVTEDLSNVVDVGTQILNLGETGVDNYCHKLVNQIGRMIFVDRTYRGNAPSVLMDGWEYGSILEKVRTVLPEAEENDTWQLQDGQSYDQDIFYQPDASAKFYNSRVTFEIPRSFAYKQVEESFQNGQQLNAFFSMLYNAVDKAITVKMDSLIMRTINTMTAATINNIYISNNKYLWFNTTIEPNAINLLADYNNATGNSLKVSQALYDTNFLKYATMCILKCSDRMTSLNTLFNLSGTDKFTPKELQHVVLLSDFVRAADVYLQSDTFHNEFTQLPQHETVPYWQGTGSNYNLLEIGGIDVKYNRDGTSQVFSTINSSANAVILGVIFDRDCLGVANLDRRVTTHYNAKGEFWNNFFKFEAGYFNDWDENFVVFYMAEQKTSSASEVSNNTQNSLDSTAATPATKARTK